MSWVPLHVHSQFSILDAMAPIETLAEKAAAFGMPACALTDHGNLFGAVDFYKACKEVKVKPIIGCEIYVAPGSRFEKKKNEASAPATISHSLLKTMRGITTFAASLHMGSSKAFITILASIRISSKTTLKVLFASQDASGAASPLLP